MSELDDRGMEARLAGLSRSAAWPETPDLRTSVVARITDADAVPDAARPRAGAVRLFGALALALVGLLVVAGVAAALGFRLPGLDLVFVDRLPPAGQGLDLGTPIGLDHALAIERPHVLVPAALPEPESAYEIDAGGLPIVTLAYRAGEGQAALAGSDLSLTVMAVPGDTDETFLSKALGPATTVTPVEIGGDRGWWISGAPHDLMIRAATGSATVLRAALVGDTLVFVHDGTLYRLESALGRSETIRIAESML